MSKRAGEREVGTRRRFLGGLAAGTAHALFRGDAIARSFGAGRDAEGEAAGELAGTKITGLRSSAVLTRIGR